MNVLDPDTLGFQLTRVTGHPPVSSRRRKRLKAPVGQATS
jgi:hypothetical protein